MAAKGWRIAGTDSNGADKDVAVDANGNLQTSAVSSTGAAQGYIGDAAKVTAPLLAETFPERDNQIIGPVTKTTAAVTTVLGLQGIHSGQFIFTLGGAETLEIIALSDGGTSIGTVLLKQIDHATPGTEVESTGLTSGTFQFVSPLNCAGLQFTKSAAVETIVLEGFMSGAA